ncbi:MAG TPA: hypothetical protein VGI39_22195 [Polyangiaceae bacterium]
MSFVASLFTWADVPFVVALGVAVAFAVLQMSGLLGALAGEADVDADGDADVDLHADVDVHADVDAGGDADADAGGDAHGDHDGDTGHGGLGSALLRGMGVGKAPLFVLGETFAVTFGVAGIALNAGYRGGAPPSALLWMLPAAAVLGLVVTRGLAGLLGRLLGDHTEAASRAELVGTSGVVISTQVDRDFGEVRLRDKNGQILRVICRAEGDAIPEGREVVVVEEDERDQRLVVAPLDVRAP